MAVIAPFCSRPNFGGWGEKAVDRDARGSSSGFPHSGVARLKKNSFAGGGVTQAHFPNPPTPSKGAPMTEPISQGAEAPKKTLVRANTLTGCV